MDALEPGARQDTKWSYERPLTGDQRRSRLGIGPIQAAARAEVSIKMMQAKVAIIDATLTTAGDVHRHYGGMSTSNATSARKMADKPKLHPDFPPRRLQKAGDSAMLRLETLGGRTTPTAAAHLPHPANRRSGRFR
jgi:hypothetical protein